MRPLVIVRPEPGASATAAVARQLGLETVVIPLFEIVPVAWHAPDPGEFDALLLTSANAVRHAGTGLERLRGLPAHCVGEATAEAARAAGLNVESTGSGRIDSLLGSLPDDLKLLHLCGIHRREPGAPKQSIQVIPVYEATAIPAPVEIVRLEGAVVAVHSPRAGARVGELADERQLRRETIAIAAISSEAADAAGGGWQRVEAAAEPSDSALLALAARLCDKR